MDNFLEIIKERRTIRNYKNQQIKEEELEQILEAGLWAPSAGGRQSPTMLISQNREINEKLGRINCLAFGGVKLQSDHAVYDSQKSIADDSSIKSGFYDAPTVITLFSPESYRYFAHDCSVAAENMSLMAWSIGIGSCYVGRAEETFDSELGKKLMTENGIEDTYKARVCLCLGYPCGDIMQGKPRHNGRIKHVGTP